MARQKARGTTGPPNVISPHQDPLAFQRVIADCDPAIKRIAYSARALVLDVLPDAFEIVWERQRNAGYGTGPKKQTEHFCWIAPATSHVSIGFNYGTELVDPLHLLEGTGKLFRHVKLATIEDVERPALRELIAAATRHRVPQLAPLSSVVGRGVSAR